MPPMSATHITARVVAQADQENLTRILPWRPISQRPAIAREPPKPATLDEKQQRNKRDLLAASANQRYDEWKGKQPAPGPNPTSASIVSHHFPQFRERLFMFVSVLLHFISFRRVGSTRSLKRWCLTTRRHRICCFQGFGCRGWSTFHSPWYRSG